MCAIVKTKRVNYLPPVCLQVVSTWQSALETGHSLTSLSWQLSQKSILSCVDLAKCTGVPRCHTVSLYTVSCQSAKCKLDSSQPVNCLGGVIAAILAIWIEEVSGLSQKSILRVVCSWQSELQTGHHGVARYCQFVHIRKISRNRYINVLSKLYPT